MTDKLASVAIALAFFVGWLTILYAGADHPSPPGFIVVILMDLVAAFVVYRRVLVYWGSAQIWRFSLGKSVSRN